MTGFFTWLTLLAPLGAAIWLTLSPSLRRSSSGPTVSIASVLLCAASSPIFLVFGLKLPDESRWT